MSALLQGFALGMSLLIAIGGQNAFVLKQGLKGEFVFWVCLVCAVSDAALIGLGVSGFSVVVAKQPWVVQGARYAGAAFLFFYGVISFVAAFRGARVQTAEGGHGASMVATLSTCLALTWLNPHVYLDTVVLVGMVSTQFAGRALYFGLGAAVASFVFFFALGYGARLLRPLFAKPVAWRVLDGLVGIVMWSICIGLVV